MTNLVENAIRYAPAGRPVTVDQARLASATELRVADAGVGIPVEMREKVFDPFVQVESGTFPTAPAVAVSVSRSAKSPSRLTAGVSGSKTLRPAPSSA